MFCQWNGNSKAERQITPVESRDRFDDETINLRSHNSAAKHLIIFFSERSPKKDRGEICGFCIFEELSSIESRF